MESGLLTIHFENWFWRRAQRASEGFNWKPILVLGFGSETICPSRGIGEAIQGSHLQGFDIDDSEKFIGDNFIF